MATILVVDDEPLIAMALEAALEDAGHRVTTAANGRQALEKMAGTAPPDLVLLDMMMPVMNGPAMLAAMAADPRLRATPVIVVSSLTEAKIRTLTTGFVATLQKPYTVHEVLGLVEQVLGKVAEADNLG
ncbi:MAG TPA: response regulator [Roseomonas sp.]|nr:response regulator [Roseomonas sp.]